MRENMGTIYYTVEADTAALLNSEKAVSKSMDRMADGMQNVDKAATGMNASMTRLASAIKLVIAASAIREMAGMVQKYQEMSERVQMATSSQAEFEMVQKRLLTTANGTYRALEEAQELYIRTADGLRSMGYSTSQAIDVTDSMSYAFVKNATAADRASATITAFSKSINTGKVAADQWETISSSLPSVINDIAAASGKSAAEIRKLGAQGKLTAQQLTEGLRKSLDANADAAAKMASNLTDAAVRSRTALTQVLVALEGQTGALQTLTDGIIMAADAMLEFGGDSGKMAATLEVLQGAALSVSAIVAGRMLMALKASTMEFYANTIAVTAKARADLAAAQSAATLAAQELILARAAEQAAIGLSTHATAATRLAVAEASATAATATLTAAQRTMAGVTTLATSAATGLRTAMAFLGGPAGIALLAAGAIYTFATRAREVKAPTDDLTKSVKELTKAQRELAALEATRKLEELGEKSYQLAENLKYAEQQTGAAGKRSQRYAEDALRMRVEQEKLNEEIATYRKRLDDLNNYSAPTSEGGKPTNEGAPTSGGTGDDNEAKRNGQILKSMRDQLELTKLIGVEQAKLEAIQKLGANATRAQREEAAKLAEELYRANELQSNNDAIRDASEDYAAVYMEAAKLNEELYVTQQLSKLSADATKEQREQMELLARETYKLRAAQENTQLLGQMDPFAGEQQRHQLELESLRKLNEAKLLEDQRYLELKGQAEIAHQEQMALLQEENFKRQSAANEMLIDTLDQLKSAGTNAMTGLLTGTVNSTEAMQMLGQAILNEAVGALVEMGIQQVKNFVMAQTQQAAAVTTAASTGTAMAASYAPAAAMASVASFGSAAVTGLAAMAAAIPAMIGLAGGRQYGGPVASGSMYRINENGAPEVFNAANGQQYMLPNSRGEVVSNADATSGGGRSMNVYQTLNINGDVSPQTVELIQNSQRQVFEELARDAKMNGPYIQMVRSKM